jgi:hypothetical protein
MFASPRGIRTVETEKTRTLNKANPAASYGMPGRWSPINWHLIASDYSTPVMSILLPQQQR